MLVVVLVLVLVLVFKFSTFPLYAYYSSTSASTGTSTQTVKYFFTLCLLQSDNCPGNRPDIWIFIPYVSRIDFLSILAHRAQDVILRNKSRTVMHTLY
jgi:hypothetical protein